MNFLYYLAFAIGAEACTIRLHQQNMNSLVYHMPMVVMQTCGSNFDVLALEIVDSNLPYLPLPVNSGYSVFDDFVNLRSLTLRNCNLESISRYDFQRLWYLDYLSLEGNSLSSLPPGALDQLGQLRTLDLSHNQFTTVDADFFKGMPYLESLDLSDNHVNYVAEAVFSGLDSLQELDLSQNLLAALPALLFEPLAGLNSLTLDSETYARKAEGYSPSCFQPVVGASGAGACRAVQDSDLFRSIGFVVRGDNTTPPEEDSSSADEYELTDGEYSEEYSEELTEEDQYYVAPPDQEYVAPGQELPSQREAAQPDDSMNLVARFVGIFFGVAALFSLAYFACVRSKSTTCAPNCAKKDPVTIDDLGNPVMLGDDEIDPLLCVFTPSFAEPADDLLDVV